MGVRRVNRGLAALAVTLSACSDPEPVIDVPRRTPQILAEPIIKPPESYKSLCRRKWDAHPEREIPLPVHTAYDDSVECRESYLRGFKRGVDDASYAARNPGSGSMT